MVCEKLAKKAGDMQSEDASSWQRAQCHLREGTQGRHSHMRLRTLLSHPLNGGEDPTEHAPQNIKHKQTEERRGRTGQLSTLSLSMIPACMPAIYNMCQGTMPVRTSLEGSWVVHGHLNATMFNFEFANYT